MANHSLYHIFYFLRSRRSKWLCFSHRLNYVLSMLVVEPVRLHCKKFRFRIIQERISMDLTYIGVNVTLFASE